MPTRPFLLKILLLSVLLAAGGLVFAQGGDPWYGGHGTGFWGLNESLGIRGTPPGMFSSPVTNPESLNGQRQYGGYRVTDAFSIEGAQTQFGPKVSSCNSDPTTSEGARTCYGTAWSLTGVATLPFESGVSLYGRLGLNYWQKGFPEESSGNRNSDMPGGIGAVYGIGLSYGLTRSITVHAESERYSELNSSNLIGLTPGLGVDSSVHSIGLSIKF